MSLSVLTNRCLAFQRRVFSVVVASSILFLSASVFVSTASAQGGATIDTVCMEDAAGFGLNCTANDINLAQNTLTIIDGCDFPGDTATIELGVNVNLTAQARHDVGIWLATDGGDALTGSCKASTLPYGPTPPFVDLDGTDDIDPPAQDLCGDINAANNPIATDIGQITVVCLDEDADGLLDIPSCTSWRQPGANEYCDSPDDAFPGTPSKCKCESLAVDVPVPGQIIVVKETIDENGAPVTSTDDFSFVLAGLAADVPFDLQGGNTFDTAVEGILIPAGTYSVAETVPTGWALDSATCDDGSDPATIEVSGGETVTCTFTNQQTFVAEPAIAITKTADPSAVSAGGDVTFTIAVENTGNVDLTGVAVSDPLAPGCDNAIGDLAIGEVSSYTCTVTNVTAGFTNVATVTDDSGLEESDDAVVTIIAAPAIDIQKTPDVQDIAFDGTAQFTITVTNTGNVDLTGVAVSDPLAPDCDNAIGDLAVGEVSSYTCTVTNVTAGFTNTANVSGTPVGGTDPVTDSDDAGVTVMADASIKITKAPETQVVETGGLATFEITVTNDGQVPLTDVTVTDALAPNCNFGPVDLAIGAVESYTCTLDDVTADFTNVAGVTGTPPAGPDVGDDDSADVDVVSPALSIVKTATAKNGDPFDASTQFFDTPGDVITYTIVATNSGDVALPAVTITDSNATLGSCTPANGSALGIGETMTCTAEYTIDQDDIINGSFKNTASADDGPGGADEVSDDETVTAEVKKVLSIVKDVAEQSYDSVGDVLNYTITATNLSNVPVDVTISDPGVTFGVCTPANGSNLAPGEDIVCEATYAVTQEDINAIHYINTATADDGPGGADPVEDMADVMALIARKLTIEKSALPAVYEYVDQVITYTYVVTNEGNVPVTDLSVTDDKTTVSCPVDTLAPGASTNCTAVYLITQNDLDTGMVKNTASASGMAPGLDPSGVPGLVPVESPEDMETVQALQDAMLTIEKNGDLNDPNGNVMTNAGETISYTISVTNSGNITLTGVTVVDDLIAIDCGTFSGTLAVDQTVTCVGTYTVTQDDLDTNIDIDNTATADSNETDPMSDSHSEQLLRDPWTHVTKTAVKLNGHAADPVIFEKAGDVITYHIVVLNNGNITLNNVVLTDSLTGTSNASCATVLAPDDTCEIFVNYTVQQHDVKARKIINTATVNSTPGHSMQGMETVHGKVTKKTYPCLTYTQDKAGPGNYGWVVYADGTKHWVDASCRADLEAGGIQADIQEWVVIDSYPDRSPLACSAIIGSGGGGTGGGGGGSGAYIVTTSDRATPPNYGWVIYPDNTKQWVDASCRASLESQGFSLQVETWSVIDSYSDGPALACADIPGAGGGGDGGGGGGSGGGGATTPYVIVTPDRAALPNYGWVVYGDNTKHWVDMACRAELQTRGFSVDIQDWGVIDAIADRTAIACEDIPSPSGGGGGGGGTGSISMVTTPDRIGGSDYGWALLPDGTKQWIDASCRDTLESSGVTLTAQDWSVISGYPDASPSVSCTQLGSL